MVDMAYTSGAYYAGSIPEAGLEPSAFAPLIYRELDDVIEVYRLRGLNEIIREGYAKYGIYFVDIITYGAPGTHWSKRPLHGVADFKGYKVRGFGHFNTVFKSLGATPTSIPHTEVYSALAQGVIDGSASDGLVYKEQRLYEVAPYYYLPGWMPSNAGGNCILVSMKSWNKLTDDLKAILKEAISATSDDFRHRTYMEHEQMLKEFGQFKSTLIVWPEEEMQKIRNVSVPILDVIAQRSPGCAKGIKIIKDYLNERGYMK
jgi:TRAP-type C4-dicarboxylate transport system substrate-binding protein